MTLDDAPIKSVAPAWHTAAVLALFLLIASLEVRFQSHPLLPPQDLSIRYSVGIAIEWLLLGLVLLGVRIRRVSPRELMGIAPAGLAGFLRDVALAVVFVIGCIMTLGVLRVAMHGGQAPPPSEAVRNLLPRTPVQLGLFVSLSFSAAVCEELIFRGYLQRQFAALAGSAMIAVIIQAMFFGLCHAYQGGDSIYILSVYGLFLGLLRQWRGGLRPGILAHFMQDAGTGMLVYFLNNR